MDDLKLSNEEVAALEVDNMNGLDLKLSYLELGNLLYGRSSYDVEEVFHDRTLKALEGDAHYKKQDMHNISPDIKEFLSSNLSPKFAKVLDVGCGFGRYKKIIEESGASYTGVDIIFERIEWCKKHVGGDFHCVGKFWNLSKFITSGNGGFDAVVCVTVIQHLGLIDSLVLLNNIWRNLAPGGILLMYESMFMDSVEEALLEYEKRPMHMIPKPMDILSVGFERLVRDGVKHVWKKR